MLKIPFGKEKNSGLLRDAGSVPNGKDCNCVCYECNTDLQAIHPKNENWQKYFRHDSNNNCTGGLESLIHQAAKQILKENNRLKTSEMEEFHYQNCDIETIKHGRRPDAFINNEGSGLIVEIFYTHKIEEESLKAYLDKDEKVLEINISGQLYYDYKILTDLILNSAPRKLYVKKNSSKGENNVAWWAFGVLAAIFLFRNTKIKRFIRRRRR